MAATAEHPLVDVRADFPVLTREFEGRRVAYLDRRRPHSGRSR